jgi:hypothetical protein
VIREELYEYLFKRTVQDLDELIDVGPEHEGILRDARRMLLFARPAAAEGLKYPDTSRIPKFMPRTMNAVQTQPPESEPRSEATRRLEPVSYCCCAIEHAADYPSGDTCPACEKPVRGARSQAWMDKLGGEDAVKEDVMSMLQKSTELVVGRKNSYELTTNPPAGCCEGSSACPTPESLIPMYNVTLGTEIIASCGPDAVQNTPALDFRGQWTTSAGHTANVATYVPAIKNAFGDFAGYFGGEIPGVETFCRWKENGYSMDNAEYDLMDRIREGKDHR